MRIILRILINAAALWVAAQLVSGIEVVGGTVNLLIVALIFGLVNAFIRPIVKLLTLPLTVVTLGLFALVINAGMLLLTSWLSSALVLSGGWVEQIVTAFIASIVISIVSTVLGWFLPDD